MCARVEEAWRVWWALGLRAHPAPPPQGSRSLPWPPLQPDSPAFLPSGLRLQGWGSPEGSPLFSGALLQAGFGAEVGICLF